MFTDRLMQEKDWTCMTVLPFTVAKRSLNSQNPMAIIYGTDPMEAATKLCVLIQIPLAGRHIL